MITYYEFSTAWYVYVMDWWCEEMFDEIVGSLVENYTDFVSSVHTTHNNWVQSPSILLNSILINYSETAHFYGLRWRGVRCHINIDI